MRQRSVANVLSVHLWYEKSQNSTKMKWLMCLQCIWHHAGSRGMSGTLTPFIAARRWNCCPCRQHCVCNFYFFECPKCIHLRWSVCIRRTSKCTHFRWQKTTLMFRIWIRANARHCIVIMLSYFNLIQVYLVWIYVGIGRWYRGKSTCLNMGIHLDKISNTHSRAFTHSAHGTIQKYCLILLMSVSRRVSVCARPPILRSRPAPSQACQTLRTTQSVCHKNVCV